MWAEGPHSKVPQALDAPWGVWGHAPPENFEKLKPLRHDFRDSDSCKHLSIKLLNRFFSLIILQTILSSTYLV